MIRRSDKQKISELIFGVGEVDWIEYNRLIELIN